MKQLKISQSVWGKPNKRIYKFVDKIMKSSLIKELCVIGCSDGSEVLIAARKGINVTAIDFDKNAIFGGKIKIGNETLKIPGLIERVNYFGLSERVECFNQDFMSYKSNKQYSGVLVSGVLHYSENNIYSLKQMIEKIQQLVVDNGFLLIEYQHVIPGNYHNCYIESKKIANLFCKDNWIITSHKVKTYQDHPNPRNPKSHQITWGKLYATKKEGE